MLKRRSGARMNPRMAAIMGVFQILRAYYGLLIASRPAIAWNVVAALINSLNVARKIERYNPDKTWRRTENQWVR